MANPDPPSSLGPSNGLERPGDGARPTGVPAPPAAQRPVGAPLVGIGQAHETTTGEKIGRFFRRAMDRLSGDESEWRRKETGRPASQGRGAWTPMTPSLRIPPVRSEHDRRADEHNRQAEEQLRRMGRDGEVESGPGRISRRTDEFRQPGRGESGGWRGFEPEERSRGGHASRDDDWTHRLARERESWNEWGERSAGLGTDWRESTAGRMEHGWQREPLAARDVMTRNPRTVARAGALRDAAVIMREENCGVVPVVDSLGRLQGILTDRDIVVRGITEDLQSSRVEDVMTDEVSAVTEDEPLTSVLDLMGRRQVRRVPVVDRNDRLLGIISMADIATRADYDEDLQDAFLRISSRRSFWSLFT